MGSELSGTELTPGKCVPLISRRLLDGEHIQYEQHFDGAMVTDDNSVAASIEDKLDQPEAVTSEMAVELTNADMDVEYSHHDAPTTETTSELVYFSWMHDAWNGLCNDDCGQNEGDITWTRNVICFGSHNLKAEESNCLIDLKPVSRNVCPATDSCEGDKAGVTESENGSDDTNNTLIIIFIILTVALITICGVVLFYDRRVKTIKNPVTTMIVGSRTPITPQKPVNVPDKQNSAEDLDALQKKWNVEKH
eukprot:UN05011